MGCHTCLSEAKISHVHTCHRGCSAYVPAQQSRIRRDLCMASADSNIFLYKNKNWVAVETQMQKTAAVAQNSDRPCAKCSALTCRSPATYCVSMSRNSASNLTALSARISMDFMREITKVTKNCHGSRWYKLGWGGQRRTEITVLNAGTHTSTSALGHTRSSRRRNTVIRLTRSCDAANCEGVGYGR